MGSGELQHCAECQEEYVAGVAACVECGRPLQPGPLRRNSSATPAPPTPAAEMNRLLGQWPGLQAHHAARALLTEGVACRVECQGSSKVYEPDKQPAEPFAVTLPVSVYVTDTRYEDAQEILQSMQQDDVIGDQWSEVPAEAESVPSDDADDDAEASPPQLAEPEPASSPLDEPVAESTSLRTSVLIVAAVVLVLYLLLGR